MGGRIYISSAFTKAKIIKCKPNENWRENDPHFWSCPPTWGICRNDFRKCSHPGEYTFFVLPVNADLPQMIYGYMKIKRIITHEKAFKEFPQKRMTSDFNKNGNIIVDEYGRYNKYDLNIHKDNFLKIKDYYIVGDDISSGFLINTPHKIINLSDNFLKVLEKVFGYYRSSVFGYLTRKGRRLDDNQVNILLEFLK